MNKRRRKAIHDIIKRLNEMLESKNDIDTSIFEDIVDETQTILDDEENYFYNIPENLQSGSRYEESESAIDKLEDAVSELEDIDDDCSQEYIKNCVSNAIKSLNDCV